MMIKTAGGPGLVSPLDFGERRKPLPRATWAAIGVVAMAHVGVGVALYHQGFEMPPIVAAPEGPIFKIEMRPPPLPEIPKVAPDVPAPPNPPLNVTPLPQTPTETVTAITAETPGPSSTTITFDRQVERPVADTSATTVATVAPPTVITNPQWISRPSGARLMRAYPQRAQTAGVAGSAMLSCIVRVDGRVGDCSVVNETPGGYGFGRAAQTLSSDFRISPRTVDGRPVEGARVAIGLRFELPN